MNNSESSIQYQLSKCKTRSDVINVLAKVIRSEGIYSKELKDKCRRLAEFNRTHSYFSKDLNDDFDYPTEEDLADNVATGLCIEMLGISHHV